MNSAGGGHAQDVVAWQIKEPGMDKGIIVWIALDVLNIEEPKGFNLKV